jgi:hypothetical protein
MTRSPLLSLLAFLLKAPHFFIFLPFYQKLPTPFIASLSIKRSLILSLLVFLSKYAPHSYFACLSIIGCLLSLKRFPLLSLLTFYQTLATITSFRYYITLAPNFFLY